MVWLGLGLAACGSSDDPTGDDTMTTGETTGSNTTGSSTTAPPADPLRNGDAEDCALGPWTASHPDLIEAVEEQSQGSSAPPVFPWEGKCFFSFGRGEVGDAELLLSQSGEAAPGTVLTLTGVFYTSGSDVATFGFGGSAPTLREAQASPERWTPFSISHVVPEGDDSWVIELSGDLFTGTGVNAYFDALTLEQRDAEPPFRPNCGDGIVNADEACDEGLANGAGRCTETCDDAYGDACILAENAACTADADTVPPSIINWIDLCFSNPSPTLDGIVGRERASLCTEAVQCIRETKCSSDFGGFEDCFCGDTPWEQCLEHDPPAVVTAAGPCADELGAAAGIPTKDRTLAEHASLERQNVLYPIGNALLLDRCVQGDFQARTACW